MKLGTSLFSNLGLQLVMLVGVCGSALAEDNTTAEIFRISQVGRSTDPDARTKLKEFFGKITTEYNAKAEQEFAAAQKSFDGAKLKIIKKLQKKDKNGQLYMVAYQGEMTVISLADGSLRKGNMTPPLELKADGKVEAMVTRTKIQKKGGNPNAKPAEEVKFFGVPIAAPDEEIVEVEVKEKVPKYLATVSTKELAAPQKMDKELFLNTLKNGETFVVERDEQRRCQECNGFGKEPWNGIGPKPADGKIPCRDCEGSGKKDWKVTYTVGW